MLTSHVGLSRRLAGSSWGADATVLCTATLALVHFMAEYCASVWCCIAHTNLIDKSINNALCIVTRCLHPPKTDNLFILLSVQPTELCCQKTVLLLACCAQEPEYLLYERLLSLLGRQLWQLKSRHPFVSAALELLNNPTQSSTNVAEYKGRMKWQENAFRLHTFIKDVNPTSIRISFLRPA